MLVAVEFMVHGNEKGKECARVEYPSAVASGDGYTKYRCKISEYKGICEGYTAGRKRAPGLIAEVFLRIAHLVCKVELEKVNVYPKDGLDGMGYPVCARKRCSSQGEKALRGGKDRINDVKS